MSRLRTRAKQWGIYTCVSALYLWGLAQFLLGFFPSKVVLPGVGSFDENKQSPFRPNVDSVSSDAHSAHFDRLILMVVDAMRSDFMYLKEYSDMSFLHGLIRNGSALPFTAFSNPPTVTLPRLKGITSGTAPSFLDAILNVADDHDNSQGSQGDSWVQQLADKGKRIHFYGDDTWLKLFPTTFHETDGTNSFFVSDFTEVDNNVTRHLETELQPTHDSVTWDALILHYLGLDHIGHKGGPDSVFMKPKQREMDEILKRLYAHVNDDKNLSKKTLIVLMGDHGMNEIGNHGGSSPGETSPGLVFISPTFQRDLPAKERPSPLNSNDQFSFYDHVNQIDLVPTLAGLLNFPIPINNLGVFIPHFLDLWHSEESRLEVLRENYRQLRKLFVAKFGDVDLLSTNEACSSISSAYTELRSIQEKLASVATDYNYHKMYLGIAACAVSSVILFLWAWCGINNQATSLGFLAFSLLSASTLHGSSLIEEEHQIWWFFAVSAFLIFMLTMRHSLQDWWPHYLAIGFGMRCIKAWNNAGQKHASTNTIALYLTLHSSCMWGLVLITYITISLKVYGQGSIRECAKLEKPKPGAGLDPRINLICFLGVSAIASVSFAFKICQFYNDGNVIPSWLRYFASVVLGYFDFRADLTLPVPPEAKKSLLAINVDLSRFATYGFAGLWFVRFRKLSAIKKAFLTDVLNIATLFLMHQTRAENIPMFLVFFVMHEAVSRILNNLTQHKLGIQEKALVVTLFVLCMQNVTFFSMGNTNSIASVDLSNAYNGVRSYNIVIVGALTFVSAYVAPLFWSLAGLCLLHEESGSADREESVSHTHKNALFLIKGKLLLAFYAFSAFSLILSCTNFRFHLFVWSVFSPKLLYFASWSIMMNTIIDMGLSLIILLFS